MLMLCPFTCATYHVTLRMDTMCTKVSCCIGWASVSWFTCSLILLTSFIVAVPFSHLKALPKKGNSLLLRQLLLLICPSNKGSVFKRLIAERMEVYRIHIYHWYWWFPLVEEIVGELVLQVYELETVIADMFYPLVYWNISNVVPGGGSRCPTDTCAVIIHEWHVGYAFKVGWKRTDFPTSLIDEVVMSVIMHNML